jgi:hypothetical protein
MKKIGLIIFIGALAVGVILANFISFGKFVFNSPVSLSFGQVKGSGKLVTEKREVSEFENVEVSGNFEVEIVVRKNFTIEVEADDNLLPLIKTEINGNTLEIEREARFSSSQPVKIRVSAPNIENLDVSGVSKVNVVSIENENLKIDTSGASSVKVQGKTIHLTVDMSGASKVDTKDLISTNVSIDGSGASGGNISVAEKLSADLSGASHVNYFGNPTEINKKTSGGSCLKQHK